MMKKRKGSIVDILPSMIMVIAAVMLIMVFFDLYQILSLNEDVKQIARNTCSLWKLWDIWIRQIRRPLCRSYQICRLQILILQDPPCRMQNMVMRYICRYPVSCRWSSLTWMDMICCSLCFRTNQYQSGCVECLLQKIKHDKTVDNQKSKGELATFTMVYVLLFFTATVAFALQIRQYISLKTYTEDALAASNLASAVIDIQEYGVNHNLIIKDPAHAYSIYQDALKVNMGLNDHWEDPAGMISSPVQVEQYIVYNVRGTEVEVTSFGENLNYSATETLGSATSPNGRVIESTSIYSRISYQVTGYFGVTVPAVKDKLVDVVKNN